MKFTQANILLSISNYIEKYKHRISTYHIYSYNYLQTKLVIFFVDCTMIIEYTENEGQLAINSGYTKDNTDKEYLDNIKYHKESYNKFNAL